MVSCPLTAEPLNQENDLKMEGRESISEENIMVEVATEAGCIVGSARELMRKIWDRRNLADELLQ